MIAPSNEQHGMADGPYVVAASWSQLDFGSSGDRRKAVVEQPKQDGMTVRDALETPLLQGGAPEVISGEAGLDRRSGGHTPGTRRT